MIDFAKTFPLPANIHITHDKPWQSGNHEDGYLIGVKNLIGMLNEIWTEMNASTKTNANTAHSNVALPFNIPMVKNVLKRF